MPDRPTNAVVCTERLVGDRRVDAPVMEQRPGDIVQWPRNVVNSTGRVGRLHDRKARSHQCHFPYTTSYTSLRQFGFLAICVAR